jgi:hypothetical protein
MGWARLVLAAVVGTGQAVVGEQRATSEYRLKAAAVDRFPQFVAWPPGTLEGRKTVDICVLEPNPFGEVLERLVAGISTGNRPTAVRAIEPTSAITRCQVLFLPANAPGRDVLLQRASGSPVLTVSDDLHFLDAGGIMQLRVTGNHVRFGVSLDAAHTAGLQLSAQLVRLATEERGGGQ